MTAVLEGYVNGWRRYADFGGRTAPRDYLYFFVINVLIGLGLSLLQGLAGGFFTLMGVVYGLAALLPGLAVTVRTLRYLTSN